MNAPVDDLRTQLRNLGYLSSGVERWFALDPFRSTTFWRELGVVVAKTTVLNAPFALAPIVAIVAIRNAPVSPSDLLLIASAWLLILAVTLAGLVTVLALALRSRAEVGVEHPRVLTLLASISSALVTLAIGWWWWGFENPPGGLELLAGAGLLVLFFIVGSIGFAAALLSFTIFETGRIPVIRHSSPTGLLTLAAAVLVALIAVPEAIRADAPAPATPPTHVPVRATSQRIAFLAIDGLRPDDAAAVAAGLPTRRVPSLEPAAPPERWATIATGVPESLHGVHAIEGVRLGRSGRILQEISSADFVIRQLLPALGLASREPLPPSVRRRAYVWEIVADRGAPATAANWWAGGASQSPLLTTTPQNEIFTTATAAADPAHAALRVDSLALESLDAAAEARLAAVYLPGLDVLERTATDQARKDLIRHQILDNLKTAVGRLRAQGWEVIIVGTPSRSGEQSIIATSLRGTPRGLLDVAPTLLDALGFPRSAEMAGASWISDGQFEIATYGERAPAPATAPDDEYYESLRSLGYIR